jgi:predicted transposase/invertase (TIGR01784 family)
MKIIHFDDDAEIIDICYDKNFKAILTQDTPQSRAVAAGIVSGFTQRDMGLISITANEPPSNNPWDRQVRYDVACKFSTGERVDVEITLDPKVDEPQRLEYYAARLFTSQNIRGSKKSYIKLNHIYQISLFVNSPLFHDNAFMHHFSYYDPENGLSFDGKTHIIIVELCKVDRIAREKAVAQMTNAERWALFLRYHTDKSKRALVNEIMDCEEDIAMAGETMLGFTQEEIDWHRNESRLKYELDMQSERAHIKEESQKEIAQNLKKLGLSVEQIAAGTGLSPEEIQRL